MSPHLKPGAVSAPRVPLRPEPLVTLQQRYAAAIAEVVHQRDVIDGRRLAPSSDPRHVFDTPAGLRLIVNLERTLGGRVGIHISASFFRPMAEDVFPTVHAANAWVCAEWQAISQSRRDPEFLGVSEGGIPHFFVERGN